MALTQIKTGGLANNSVTNAKMADNAIDSVDIAAGSIDNAHLAGSIAVSKTLLAGGTGLTLSTNTLNVDAAQTQITSVGTLTGLTTSGNINLSATNTLFLDGASGHTFISEYSANKMQLQAGGQGSVILDGTNSGEIRMGVGTSSPDSKIHAKVTTNTSETIRIQNDDSLTTVGVSSDGYSFHTYQHSLYWASWDGSTWSTKGRMDSHGNLGVGTTDFNNMSSSSYAGLKVGGATLQDSGGGNGSATFLTNNSYVGGSNNLYLDAGGAASAILMTSGDIDFLTFDGGGGSADAQWSYTPRMKIAQNGNVAIGKTSDASEKLEVYDGDILVSSGRGVRANGGQEMIRFDSSDGVKINSGNAERMRILTDGRVAIKATSLPEDFGGERGQLCISSVDNAGANNYAVLQLQGHSVANDVGVGSIAFYDHSNNTAMIQTQRNSSTSTGNILFYTHNGSALKNRMEIRSDGEVRIGEGEDGYLRHYQINSSAHNYVIYTYSDDSYRWNRNGSGSDEMRIESDGDLHILGSLSQNSDIRLKKNIKTIEGALSKVNQLRGVTYNWNKASGKDTEIKQLGMIADEVEEIIPELVKTDSVKGSFDEKGLDNIKSLKYGNVVGLLVEAVKELSAKVTALENA